MAETKSITRKHNHDDDASSSSSSSSRKRIMNFNKDGVAPWSDLNNDVLFILVMKLGVVDFLALSGVCKSWRSFVLCNKNTFMASRPPMSLDCDNHNPHWYLEDFEGRRFKTTLPHSGGRFCIGLTCGYLIFFGSETRDFWLVNPIKRHALHFPYYPLYTGDGRDNIRALLVFSDSISGWVLVTLRSSLSRNTASKQKISFCIAGKRGWNHVFSSHSFFDLHAFKGKIYTLHTDCCLRELRLNLKRKCKSTLLEIMSFQKSDLFRPELVSSGENLYIVNRMYSADSDVLELDFGEMKWVSPEKTMGEYAFFLSMSKSCAAFKLGSWPGPPTQYKSYLYSSDTGKSKKYVFYHKWIWYFPHDCLNVSLIDE